MVGINCDRNTLGCCPVNLVAKTGLALKAVQQHAIRLLSVSPANTISDAIGFGVCFDGCRLHVLELHSISRTVVSTAEFLCSRSWNHFRFVHGDDVMHHWIRYCNRRLDVMARIADASSRLEATLTPTVAISRFRLAQANRGSFIGDVDRTNVGACRHGHLTRNDGRPGVRIVDWRRCGEVCNAYCRIDIRRFNAGLYVGRSSWAGTVLRQSDSPGNYRCLAVARRWLSIGL